MTDPTIYIHGSAHQLSCLDDESINSIVTSPPYFGTRQYHGDQITNWPEVSFPNPFGGGSITIPASSCELGREEMVNEYIAHLIICLREWRRVLHPSGLAIINLGDTYASQKKAHGRFKPKDLMMIPSRFALAAWADGWYVRNFIPWLKDNGMPGNYDRFVLGHEDIIILSKSPAYFFDRVAIRQEPAGWDRSAGTAAYDANGTGTNGIGSKTLHVGAIDGRNARTKDVVTHAIHDIVRNLLHNADARQGGVILDDENLHAIFANHEQSSHKHFAPFPKFLAEMMIRCSTSAHGVCANCLSQYERIVEKLWGGDGQDRDGYILVTTGWKKPCNCPPSTAVIPATVLDPFAGTGTTAVCAAELGRHAVLVDINSDYLTSIAAKRLDSVQMKMF